VSGGNWHPAVAAAHERPERLLRPHQVARLLGVTAQHVRWLWRTGKLAGHKSTERNLKIPESAVRAFLESVNREG
jgi:excisionase family DNA binding protein